MRRSVDPLPSLTLRALELASRMVCALLIVAGSTADAASLLLSNAHVIDPAIQQEYLGYVLIEDAHVVEVRRTRPADFHDQEVDLAGKYLIPVLVDAHVHSEGNRAPIGEVARSMGEQRIFSIPTMAVQQDFLNILEDHRILDSPLLHSVSGDALIESYRRLDPVAYADCPTCNWQREGRKHYGVSLRRLLSAGVRIVAGSDTGNLGTFQGFSLHRELVVLNQWGLSPWQALAAATTHAYELLGLNMGFKPGAEATFVVLDASPLTDIANTQRIDRILVRGKWVDREALRAR